MSLVDLALNEVPDLTPVEPGEYRLTITSASYKEGREKGTPMVALSMDIDELEDSQTVFHNLILPTDDDEVKKGKTKRRMIKDFCDAFSINYDTMQSAVEDDDYDALVEESGSAILVQDEFEGRVRNNVKRFVVSA